MAEPHATYKVIERQVGLLGGTVLLVGTVIGISVFLLPGELIGDTGPSITVGLAITAVPMIFSVLMLLQLGGAMPVAGGVYVYASRLIGPVWGFLMIWLVIPGIWSTLLFTSIGFAEFTRFFVDIPAPLLMAGVLTLFLFLNLRGITLVAWVQLAMVAAIIVGFLIFVIPGAFQVDASNYTPMFPEGTGPFLLSIVSLYIPFQGYSMIVELGEELKDPLKNIPRVLLLGMTLAVLLSLALVIVFAGLDRYDVLGGFEEGGIATASAEYISPLVGGIVAFAAVLGALTTLNAVITSYSRTIMRAARDEVLSLRLAAIHPRFKVPHWSIVALSLPPILLVPIAPSAVVLSVFLALIILFGGFISAIALWNLPKRFPEAYENSVYKLPMPILKLAAIGSAASSVVFWLLVVAEALPIVAVIVLIGLTGYAYYRYRCAVYARRGVDLRRRLTRLHDQESLDAGVTPRTDEGEPAVDDGTPTTPATGRRPPKKVAVAVPPPSRRGRTAAMAATTDRSSTGGNGDRDAVQEVLSGLEGLGPVKAATLAEHFPSLEALRTAELGELTRVRGVGERTALALQEQLEQEDSSSDHGRDASRTADRTAGRR